MYITARLLYLRVIAIMTGQAWSLIYRKDGLANISYFPLLCIVEVK